MLWQAFQNPFQRNKAIKQTQVISKLGSDTAILHTPIEVCSLALKAFHTRFFSSFFFFDFNFTCQNKLAKDSHSPLCWTGMSGACST